uniref:Uncharacterized protein n=1 Tax=Chromera velia CCMP2878 TaxID=1169474 RepID=A0A0G4FWF5_9ALVE|eukprot:Cvel_19083.t1-p1 / transcript=Cvel_19083.t1 / gene=Cvel_19083 / organism=Chromera_velia_CCMP2878 / gene_product=hypothetical protein / transcript_product=hypothetical protein / location=Cvel_scaffold1620:7111-8199(+) / protein_length=363 / sequence_SO=supercontig / SO=protein_coding / is_pseudo=false
MEMENDYCSSSEGEDEGEFYDLLRPRQAVALERPDSADLVYEVEEPEEKDAGLVGDGGGGDGIEKDDELKTCDDVFAYLSSVRQEASSLGTVLIASSTKLRASAAAPDEEQASPVAESPSQQSASSFPPSWVQETLYQFRQLRSVSLAPFHSSQDAKRKGRRQAPFSPCFQSLQVKQKKAGRRKEAHEISLRSLLVTPQGGDSNRESSHTEDKPILLWIKSRDAKTDELVSLGQPDLCRLLTVLATSLEAERERSLSTPSDLHRQASWVFAVLSLLSDLQAVHEDTAADLQRLRRACEWLHALLKTDSQSSSSKEKQEGEEEVSLGGSQKADMTNTAGDSSIVAARGSLAAICVLVRDHFGQR